MYLKINVKCCWNFVKFNKKDLTLTYESTIKNGVNVEDDDSLIDNYVSPWSTQISPNVVGEEEVNDVYANRNDHDEGELINIV